MKALILKNINTENFNFKSVWTLVLLLPLLVFIFIPEDFSSIITFASKALMGTKRTLQRNFYLQLIYMRPPLVLLMCVRCHICI